MVVRWFRIRSEYNNRKTATYRNKNLSSHVAAFLCSRFLVLKMHASCTRFNKELGQLHDCRQPAVTSISVGNDWSEIVNFGSRLFSCQ